MQEFSTELVSVILPTYGDPTKLRAALMSVFAQSYKNVEVIVVDDNGLGTDASRKTEKVINGLRAEGYELKYICHDVNKNGAAARNTGASHSKGKFVAFLDADDEYFPDRIRLCVEALSSAEHRFAGVYSGCEFRRHGKKVGECTRVWSGNFLLDTLCCVFNFCSGSNLFLRREVLTELGGFDESFIRHQDYELLVRLFENYELIGLPNLLLVKNDEQHNQPNVERMIQVKNRYIGKYRYLIDEMSAEDQDKITYFNSISLAEQALGTGKWRLAFEYYLRAVRSRPPLPRHVIRLIGIFFKRLLGGQ